MQDITNEFLQLSTIHTGFYDYPPSQASGSLNPKGVAKLRGFLIGR